MANEFTYRITTTAFDEDYAPSESSRATTNFANLARGDQRQENLRNALTMIDRRFNDLAREDNPDGDRYAVELEIVSVELRFDAEGEDREFPLIEVLDVEIVDRATGEHHPGIVGNNFSSYVRDYDFSVLLPSVSGGAGPSIPDDFGDLHGKLFQHFLDSDAYRERFAASPVICISVSTSRTYRQTEHRHPVLGVEYVQDGDASLTDAYFGRMGLQVRYFMPPGGKAPLALYFRGDLLSDYSDLQLIGTISTMESFQKIYRPEIYNANSAAASIYRPSLTQQDYSLTKIIYDREERSRLAVTQGAFTDEHFITPHGDVLRRWAADYSAAVR